MAQGNGEVSWLSKSHRIPLELVTKTLVLHGAVTLLVLPGELVEFGHAATY